MKNKYTESQAEEKLRKVFKAYDVRGLVGEELNEDIALAVGAAFVDEVGATDKTLVVGYDMRDSSPLFAKAFAEGASKRGADIKIMGLCSTDANYFASGLLDADAAMFTASHNPAAYNGIKMSRKGAKSMSSETGLESIRERAVAYMVQGVKPVAKIGEVHYEDLLVKYVEYLRELVPLEDAKPLKIVIDTANGMGGFISPAVLEDKAGFKKLPFNIVPMYFELDGNFPNHEANPLDTANLKDLQKKVLEEKADLGLAFDGDADRCFAVDNNGEPVPASAVAAIVSKREIERVRSEEPGKPISVLHSLTCSKKVLETIKEHNAEPIRIRVGHSFAKDEMAKTGAIFGGEHSGHFYFQKLWGADSGMLAALHVIAEVSSTGKTMAELAKQYTPYFASGEINSTVTDAKQSVHDVIEELSDDTEIDYLDGVFISSNYDSDDFWWISLRSSNTEPLLRLNVEASTLSKMEEIRDKVLSIIRK